MRALHLLDASADWRQRVAVNQLLDRLDTDQHSQWLVSVDARRPPSHWFPDHVIERAAIRFGLTSSASPAIRRIVETRSIDTIHAWGIAAASAAAYRPASCGLILHHADPHISKRQAETVRALAETERFAAACETTTVRRRMVERGVPAECCVVLRPGVDFKRINAAKKDHSIRERLGIGRDDRLLLAALPVQDHTGHEHLIRSAYLRNHVDPSCRLVLCEDSPRRRRLQGLARHLPAETFVWAGDDLHYEDLIAAADVLVITPFDDVPTTSIAWAMAASTLVVGTAVYSVAEFIAHKNNGLLIKPDRSARVIPKIASALGQTTNMAKEKEVARGQAFEVFSVRRFVDQTLQIAENLSSGTSPGDNIPDPASVA